MKQFRKTAAVFLCLSVLIFSVYVPVRAENETPYFYSGAATAGYWKTEGSHTVSSLTLPSLYGGDVGINFFYNAVGLQSSFVYTSSRTVDITFYNEDLICAHHYRGYFGLTNNYYRPISYSTVHAYSSLISSTSSADMHLVFQVGTISGDLSASVKIGLLKYKFWAY